MCSDVYWVCNGVHCGAFSVNMGSEWDPEIKGLDPCSLPLGNVNISQGFSEQSSDVHYEFETSEHIKPVF